MNDTFVTQKYWVDNPNGPPLGSVMKIDGYRTVLTLTPKGVLEWKGENKYGTYDNWDVCEHCKRPKIHAYIYAKEPPCMDRMWSIFTCYVHTQQEIQKAQEKFPTRTITIGLPFRDKF